MPESTRNTVLWLAAFCASYMVSAQAQARPTKAIAVPTHFRAVSPDDRYVIIGVESDGEPYHTVFLEDRKLKTRRKLFNYDRHIELLWNPDSKSFALTDYAGSDYSRCSIISVHEGVPSIQVWDELVSGAKGSERRSLLENHHVYIAATEWTSSVTLRVRVWGYGEVNRSGFTRHFLYEVGRGVRRRKS